MPFADEVLLPGGTSPILSVTFNDLESPSVSCLQRRWKKSVEVDVTGGVLRSQSRANHGGVVKLGRRRK
jgi:hypothetical protein